jgi:hypothetical protein
VVKSKYDSSVRRGAIVKAICAFSKYQFVECLKKPLDLALEAYFQDPSVAVLAEFYRCINTIDLQHFPRPSLLEHCVMRRGVTHETADELKVKLP